MNQYEPLTSNPLKRTLKTWDLWNKGFSSVGTTKHWIWGIQGIL